VSRLKSLALVGLLALAFLPILPSVRAQSLVGQAHGYGDGGDAAINYGPTASNVVVVGCGGTQPSPVNAVTDNLGNRLTELQHKEQSGGLGFAAFASIWAYVVPSAGVASFLASGADYHLDCWAVELSGYSLASIASSVGSGVVGTSLSVAPFAPAADSFLMVVAGDGNGGYFTAGTDFTVLLGGSHAGARGGGEYNDSWAGGTTTAPFTGGADGYAWAEVAAAFVSGPPLLSIAAVPGPTASTGDWINTSATVTGSLSGLYLGLWNVTSGSEISCGIGLANGTYLVDNERPSHAGSYQEMVYLTPVPSCSGAPTPYGSALNSSVVLLTWTGTITTTTTSSSTTSTTTTALTTTTTITPTTSSGGCSVDCGGTTTTASSNSTARTTSGNTLAIVFALLPAVTFLVVIIALSTRRRGR
jgi:hypothetical protein